MIKVYRSAIINAPVDKVWKLVRDFNGLPKWHPAIATSEIEGGLPADLRAEMMAWCVANCADERKPGQTDEQFLYVTRKKALGPYKEALWSLPADAEAEVAGHLREQFGLLFDRLGVGGTRGLVDRWVEPTALTRPRPVTLGGSGVEAVLAGADAFADDGSGE